MKRSHLYVFLSLVVLMALPASPQQPPAGLIFGSVQDAAGKPLIGYPVLIDSRPSAEYPAGAFRTVVKTTSEGAFSLTGAPDGTYSVCPFPLGSAELPPCNWGDEPRVTIRNRGWAALPPIKIQTAVDFYVRVNDNKGVRDAHEGKDAGTALVLNVVSPNGRMFPVPLTAHDKNGYDHHLKVPAGADLVFQAAGRGFAMSDENGKGIDNAQGLTKKVNIPPGQAQHKEIINLQ